jgi:hypothetical protein
MQYDNFPRPVSDPEAEGLPRTADDDSTAYDDVDSPRVADGPEPAPLPSDEPQAMDRYGNTAEDARLGESMDYKLAREQPDVDDEPEPAPSRGDDAPPLDDETDQPDADAGLLDAPAPLPPLGSPVSVYDAPDVAPEVGHPVGRLVEPDAGSGIDDEPDAIAFDAGAAGGGPSAEELAMHEVTEP